MGNKRAGRSVLTKEQKEAAEKLLQAWKKNKKGLTQAKAAETLEMTQGAFWQYLHGWRPLNWPALKAICGLINVDPEEIYPEMAQELGPGTRDRRSDLPPEALEVAYLWRQLQPSTRSNILAFLRMAVYLTRNGMEVTLHENESLQNHMRTLEKDMVERRNHDLTPSEPAKK